MTDRLASQRRSLLRHGFTFLFIGVWLGIGTATLPHPGKWMAAHLTALLTAVTLVVIGLVWRELRLTSGQQATGFWCGVTSAYLGLAANVFAALVDLPGPASNPGVAPPMPQAAVFFSMLAVIVPTTLVAFGLVLYGLRGNGTPNAS